MYNILICSEDLDKANDYQYSLERYLQFKSEIITGRNDILARIEKRKFHLVLYDCKQFDVEDYKVLRDLKIFGFNVPVVVSLDELGITEAQATSKSINAYFMNKPVAERRVCDMIGKLAKAYKLPRQKFQRFITNQIAQLESLNDGENYLTNMYNLSKGGAYFEFEGTRPLKVGEFIKMRVALEDTNREYSMNAKVVWSTAKGMYSGRRGIGCQFVSTQDMYQLLMQKV